VENAPELHSEEQPLVEHPGEQDRDWYVSLRANIGRPSGSVDLGIICTRLELHRGLAPDGSVTRKHE